CRAAQEQQNAAGALVHHAGGGLLPVSRFGSQRRLYVEGRVSGRVQPRAHVERFRFPQEAGHRSQDRSQEMMRAAASLLLLSFSLWGQDFRLGAKAPDFAVTGLDGRESVVAPGRGAVTAVVFISAVCPMSNSYNVRMSDLYREYAGKPVKFVFINANQNES